MSDLTEISLEAICEAALFVSPRPLSPRSLAALSGRTEKEVRAALAGLRDRYEGGGGGLVVQEVGGKFQLVTCRELAPFLEKLTGRPREVDLSRAAMETLAAVAFHGPVTRGDIEAMRGVNSEGALITLIERDLVREAGRKETLGRPFLYVVTGEFFRRFGLKDAADLRRLGEKKEKGIQETQISFPKKG